MGEKTVPELARDTLKQLVIRKLAPTPANYEAIFNEIGGLKTESAFLPSSCARSRRICRPRRPASRSSAA
jgi:diguanylate cyclase